MKKLYQLIKLRVDTVDELKRLRAQMGKPGLDDLIQSMIQMVDRKRLDLKETGWKNRLSGEFYENQSENTKTV
jgi:hypothetical protein